MSLNKNRVLEFMRLTKDLIEALVVLAIGGYVAYQLYLVRD